MNNKKYLPLGWDGLFKKMYGDVNNTIKAENLIGLIFNIKSELLRGKVEILNNEMLQLSKDDKKQERDIVAKVIFSNEMKYINLEANIHSYGQILIDRNMGYISNIFANQLRSGEAYSLIAPTIQINFSIHDTETSPKDSKRVVSTYFLTNEYNEILTKKLQIIDIYIDNCYKIWYNDGIEEYNEYEQTIIRLGALHYITNNDEFRKCLGELKMDNDVKNMFQNDMNEYQEDKDLVMSYDREQHLERIKKSYELEHEKNQKEYQEHQKEYQEHQKEYREHQKEYQEHQKEYQEHQKEYQEHQKEYQEYQKEYQEYQKEQDAFLKKINEFTDKENEFNDKKVIFDNEKQEFIQNQINIAKKLLSKKVDINEISELICLSVEQIKDIKL